MDVNFEVFKSTNTQESKETTNSNNKKSENDKSKDSDTSLFSTENEGMEPKIDRDINIGTNFDEINPEWREHIQDITTIYDRENGKRDAIIDHSPINDLLVINGLSQEEEENVSGYQLDLDKYHDEYKYEYTDSYNQEEEKPGEDYIEAVSKEIKNDIARFEGINLSSDQPFRELYNNYEKLYNTFQALVENNNELFQEPNIDISSDDPLYEFNYKMAYINDIAAQMAVISWDSEYLTNDYIDMNFKTDLTSGNIEDPIIWF